MGLKTGFAVLTRILHSSNGLKSAKNVCKQSKTVLSSVAPDLKVGDAFISRFSQSNICSQIEGLILKHAPADKQLKLLEKFKNYANDSDSIEVLESLFEGISKNTKFKGADFIKEYNKLFNNLRVLQENNPEEFKIMIDGGFFKLLREGKIHPENFRTEMSNARISRTLLEDLKKAAKGEDFVPDLSNLSFDEIRDFVKNGETYLKDGKLFINGDGITEEIALSKEKFLELFPPVLRNISEQGNIGNCWFVGQLDNLATSESGRVGLLKLFRQKGNDIFIRFPNCEKEILFPSGKILTTKGNKQMRTIPGLAMIEQAMAVHYGNLYSEGIVTSIENFSQNPNRLLNILESIKYGPNISTMRFLSGETIDRIWRTGWNAYIPDTVAANFKSLFSSQYNRKIMRKIITEQANNQNLHIGLGFINSTPQELTGLYNMVPHHELTLKAIESDICYISNPWFNWIEKGVSIETLLKYIRDMRVPMIWG